MKIHEDIKLSSWPELFFVMAILFFFCVRVFAQNAGIPDGDVNTIGMGLLPGIVAAFTAGKSLIGGAGVVLLLVLAFKSYGLPKLGLSTEILPFVSLILGILWATIYGVYTGLPVKDAAALVLAGPLASQFWDVAGQHLIAWFKNLINPPLPK